ncbi:nucleotidyltransferase domain-containing protein [Candidatus Parcubacteria bacterium]|nr:nucleotidyltransferase domain-containing protein [Candidatus Parcubacteria bacterium]
MTKKIFEKSFLSIFNSYPEIKLVYFFGSRAKNNYGPLSDYDFAIFLDEKDKKKMFKIKLEMLDKISRALKTDKVDIVILNILNAPEMKYNIITKRKLIFEKEPFKILTEPKILMEYFDFRMNLSKYNLIKT